MTPFPCGAILYQKLTPKSCDMFQLNTGYYEDGQLMREDNYDKKEWKQYGPDGNLIAEGKM